MDVKEVALASLKSAFKVFRQDLEALPDDVYLKKFGPATRTVADIVYEVNLVNDHVGMVIRGEKPFDWPEGDWIYAPESLNSKETVMAAYDKSSQQIMSTVEGFDRDEFELPIKTDEGETTRFERCRFMTLHLWYHSGQLNYVQTLIGDAEWHWK